MATTTIPTYFSYSENLFPSFEGENYTYWSLQMKTLFMLQDLWELVEDRFELPEDVAALAA